MQSKTQQRSSNTLLASLVGDDCSWCRTGTLAREEFKSDDAAVCDECGTPGARVW
jgi:hypothetical protein